MKTATVCPTNQQLKALTLGQLSSEDSDALFQHIAECDQCRSELETVEDVGDSLIANLRGPSEYADFSAEPDCRVAVVKALGALAISERAARATESDRLPKTIGEYEIVRKIGRGGMSSVFLAKHTKLGREVALKVLASHRLIDSRTVERFEAEMRAVGRLSHPNIVIAHDAREVEGMAVLVTEYVPGLDVGQLLQRTGRLKVAEACEIARRVAVALEYTNSQGFVHRDIKPSNVMLSDEGEIKLLDLGLARLQYSDSEPAELTGTGQAMGTADYVAPEQVADSKSVDIRADIYSLGCTLFKLLTGRAPFADDQHLTTFAKMTAHVSSSPPSLAAVLPSAPRTLVQLVDSMLAKQPTDRPSTPRDVASALQPHCKDHDLKKLISDTQLLEPRKQSSSATSTTVRPTKPSWLKRTVPTSFAIGAGFMGILLGVCLSIIILITNPHGTKTLLQLAEGSKVEISYGDINGLSGASTPMPNGAKSNGTAVAGAARNVPVDNDITPLSFGVFVNRESTGHAPTATDAQILEATRLLRASDGSKPVHTPAGTWYSIANSELGAPIKEMNAGKSFVLVSDQQSIRWPSIAGHIISSSSSIKTGEGQIELELDKELGSSFSKLTKQNIRNQLAIIVNGQIRSAPIINSEIGEKVSITGVFNSDELTQLRQWLHEGLVYQLPMYQLPKLPAGQASAQEDHQRIVEEKIRQQTTNRRSEDLQRLEVDLTTLDAAYQIVRAALGEGHPYVRETEERIQDLQSKIESLNFPQVEPNTKPATPPDSTRPTTSLESSDSLIQATRQLDQLKNNLREIGLAFFNFHDAHSRFPGTSNTHPVHGEVKIYPFSWRVAILRWLGHDELYQQYHFDEPWDSEHNLTLLDKMPAIYRSPFADADQPAGETNILGFASETSAFGTGGGEKINSFTDGISNTLLLSETACTVPWTKPQDVPGDASQAQFFEGHPFTFLMANGSVESGEQPALEVLNEMISRNGGVSGVLPRISK